MSNARDIIEGALPLLERADQLRAKAYELLLPVHKARGWRGPMTLSSIMTNDLPPQKSLARLRDERRKGFARAWRSSKLRGSLSRPSRSERAVAGRSWDAERFAARQKDALFPQEDVEKLTGPLLAGFQVVEFAMNGKFYRTAHLDRKGRVGCYVIPRLSQKPKVNRGR